MCEGFGVIVTKDGRYLWIEPDSSGNVSHSDVLRRAGIKDNDKLFTRMFVRVEIPTWKIGSFRFDEDSTLPGWVDEDAVKTYCNKLLKRVAPAWAEYNKVKGTALAEYEKVKGTAWAEYNKVMYTLAEYNKVMDTAWAEYNKVMDTAWAEYNKVMYTLAEYKKVRDTALAEYEKVKGTAWAEYNKVMDTAWAEMVEKLSSIEGYVKE